MIYYSKLAISNIRDLRQQPLKRTFDQKMRPLKQKSKGVAVRNEIAEMTQEVNEKIRQELFSLAENSRVGVWVDSNVVMYSENEYKNRLLEFPNLRTIPEVATETQKRDVKTSYLLKKIVDVGGAIVGRDLFQACGLIPFYDSVLDRCATYSPITQGAIVDNLRLNGSTSPVEHNALHNITEDCDFLETPEEMSDINIVFWVGEFAQSSMCKVT